MAIPPRPPLARLELAEGRAYRSLYEAAARLSGNPFRIATAEVGGAIAFQISAAPIGFFNRAVGLGVVRAAREADVADLTSFYERGGIAESTIQVAPEVESAAVTGWLEAHGHRRRGAWVKLSHDLGTLPVVDSEIEFERIGPEASGAWGDVVCAAFEMPEQLVPLATSSLGERGWVHYLGRLEGRPVSAAAMFVDGDTAWLGFGATLPEARRRGGQRRSFADRLADAKAMGCSLAVTETGAETDEAPVNPSLRNMIAVGFAPAYDRRNWVRGGT